MINKLALRAKVESALSELIGIYTLINDAGAIIGTTPAIVVETAAANVPVGTIRVAGLEVVIRPNLDLDIEQLHGGFLAAYSWEIYLKQWDLLGDTVEATSRLLRYVAEVSEVRPRVPRNTDIDTIETRSIILNYPEIIRQRA
jgi:hypothetical protein